MNKPNNHDIMPVQPYIMINTDDYERVVAKKTGISHFYEFTKTADTGHINAVPDGTVDLLFGINEKDVKSYIGGTVLRAKDWPLEDGRTYFGVRFLPGKCMLPAELCIRDIVNDDLELDKNAYGEQLAERLAEAKNIYERSGIFMDYYMETLRKKNVPDSAQNIESYVRNRIYESRGTISIRELAEESGYSECYIRRVFGEVHGISPKVFEKIVRFQNLLDVMEQECRKADTSAGNIRIAEGSADKSAFKDLTGKSGTAGLQELSADSGYYDQSHMIKDFKNYTGVTPEAYRKMLAELKLRD